MYTSFTKKPFLPLLIRFQRCYVEQHKRSSDWDRFFPNSVLHQCSWRQGWITYYACPWHHLFTCLACAQSTCAKWNSCIGDYFILDHLLNSYLWMPTKEKFYEYARNATHGKKCYAIQGSRKMFTVQLTVPAEGGYSGFSSDGDDRMESKVKTQKNPRGFQQNPKKSLDQTLTPQKSHVSVNLTFQTHKSQAKEIKSSLRQKGIPVTVKPIDWIEAVEVLYTAGHHGTMQTIV